MLGYAFYAAIFAVAASLVSRQEDLGTVIMPTTLVLVVAFFVGIQACGRLRTAPLAAITSYVPGLSPLVMPVRQAAGDVALWEIALAVVLMLVAIALIVRLGGRVYAGALLRTGGGPRSARRCGPSASDAATGAARTARAALPGGSAAVPRLRRPVDRLPNGRGSRAAWACSWATR